MMHHTMGRDKGRTATQGMNATRAHRIAEKFADALIAAREESPAFTAAALRERLLRVFGWRVRTPHSAWLGDIARFVATSFDGPLTPTNRAELCALIAHHPSFEQTCVEFDEAGTWPKLRGIFPSIALMSAPNKKLAAQLNKPLPALTSVIELAAFLGIAPSTLESFTTYANLRLKRLKPVEHYHCALIPKRDGGLRLIEAPKSDLKAAQRRLLHQLLALVPPHAAAHGFVRQRGAKSYATPHAGQAVVLRFDLADFFVSIPMARVAALFRSLGYPQHIVTMLAQLCGHRHRNPRLLTQLDPSLRARARDPHLPQGAPTSPALANLCAYRLDVRLAGLAQSLGAQYTRYADDLAFSGSESLARRFRWMEQTVTLIAREEGFSVNARKTRKMKPGVRQVIAGVVVNDAPAAPRHIVRTLQATLFNCIKHGPQSQNRTGEAYFRAHLLGNIAWVRHLNPVQGGRLMALFRQIKWDKNAHAPGLIQ